jgi:hypothetical protein
MVIKGAGIIFSWPEPVGVWASQRPKVASYKATSGYTDERVGVNQSDDRN